MEKKTELQKLFWRDIEKYGHVYLLEPQPGCLGNIEYTSGIRLVIKPNVLIYNKVKNSFILGNDYFFNRGNHLLTLDMIKTGVSLGYKNPGWNPDGNDLTSLKYTELGYLEFNKRYETDPSESATEVFWYNRESIIEKIKLLTVNSWISKEDIDYQQLTHELYNFYVLSHYRELPEKHRDDNFTLRLTESEYVKINREKISLVSSFGEELSIEWLDPESLDLVIDFIIENSFGKMKKITQ